MSILLLHGFRGNHLGLAQIADALRRSGYEVYVPDIPPALSEKSKNSSSKLDKTFFTTSGYADWVAEYIKSNHLKKPIIIGHSMGSIITAATAEKHPDLIHKKVIFLAPISVKPPRFITNLAPLSAVLPNRFASYISTKYLIIQKNQLKPILRVTNLCGKNMTGHKDVARAAKFSSTYCISDFNLKNKSFCFIAGVTDRLNSKEATEKTAKKFNGKLVFLENTGHLLNYECPITVANEIKKFIEE